MQCPKYWRAASSVTVVTGQHSVIHGCLSRLWFRRPVTLAWQEMPTDRKSQPTHAHSTQFHPEGKGMTEDQM